MSESGYYRYLRRKSRPNRDALLSAKMQGILDEHPLNKNYGGPRMQQALFHRGVKAGLRRVKRIMRENGWLHERRRRPKGLTKADPAAMASENLLKQDFHADKPFMKLLTDITQVQCKDGKLYISPIMDCFNGEILSLFMQDNMKKELCIDTVKAMAGRFPVRGTCPVRSDAELERCGPLLRQRPDGELLCDIEEGTDLPNFCLPSEHGGCQVSGVPICVRLLQPRSGLHCQSRRMAPGNLEKDVLSTGGMNDGCSGKPFA